MRTLSLPITGMTCGGCVASATKALQGVPGVKRVQVSLTDQAALITADEAVTTDALVAALERVGFTARPGSELA